MGKIRHLLAATGCVSFALGATPDEWRSRSIYQLLTDRFALPDGSNAPCDTSAMAYCGGTYKGIMNHLDYIQGMGFDSIWISPITEQMAKDTDAGSSYHGYWQSNLYGFNTNFGSVEDLQALTAELHARDMFLMIDVVANHNGWAGDSSSVDYSIYNPFNSQEYYHSPCEISNYDDQDMVEHCWLSTAANALPDLKTEDQTVSDGYNTWISSLVANYSADGLRVDTVKHVDKEFWQPFNKAAGVYCVGEVLDGDPAYTCPYQDVMDGVLNYPVYYSLIDAFKSPQGSIDGLVNQINAVSSACSQPQLLGLFVENHDLPRFASYTKDVSLGKNVVTFNILADGIPIVYYGQEQQYSGSGDPSNREALWLSGYNKEAALYTHIAAVNKIRSFAVKKDEKYITTVNTIKYSDGNSLAMAKGSILTVLTNLGADGADKTITIENSGLSGELTDVLSCDTVTAGDGGNVEVTLTGGLPRVFYPSADLSGSGLCEG